MSKKKDERINSLQEVRDMQGGAERPMLSLRADKEFVSWVAELKTQIRSSQIKAAIRVNAELLRLYWKIGEDICRKAENCKWGDGWIRELSRELSADFPNMKGLSYRNLQYMRKWYLFYNQRNKIVQQLVAQLGDNKEKEFDLPILRQV